MQKLAVVNNIRTELVEFLIKDKALDKFVANIVTSCEQSKLSVETFMRHVGSDFDITYAFVWDKSNEGFQYWDELFEKCNDEW